MDKGSNIIRSSGSNDDNSGICSSYSDGMCLEEPGKYCDCCATFYGNLDF